MKPPETHSSYGEVYSIPETSKCPKNLASGTLSETSCTLQPWAPMSQECPIIHISGHLLP